jgi:hypothetical protein
MLKVCAKLTNGVKLGFGFALERACDAQCTSCRGTTPFFRQCRFFDFLPHYKVALVVPVPGQPVEVSFSSPLYLPKAHIVSGLLCRLSIRFHPFLYLIDIPHERWWPER